MKWEKVSLSKLVEEYSVRGKDIKASDKLEFYGVSNEFGIINAKYSANEKHEDYKVIENGCFAYNPYRINVGSIGLYSDKTIGLVSPAYVVFKQKPNSILPELLLKFLKSEEGLRQIKLYARGTVRQALRFDDLCKIELSLPDYDEQILLFEKLNSMQVKSELLINEFSYQQELIFNIRQQILQDAIQGQLVPQDPNDEPASVLLEKIKAEKEKLIKEKKIKKGKPLPPIKEEEIPFELPKNWSWCRLENVSINRDESRVPVSKEERNIRAKIYDYYGASGVIDKIDGYTHKGEFLLIGEDGANLKAKSTPIAFIAKGRFWVNNHAHVLEFYDKTLLDYMVICLNIIDINSFITGGFQPKLSQSNLNIIPVPIPPLTEQQRIVKKVAELLKVCDELEIELKQNQNLTQQLLQSALKEALEPKN